MATSGVRNFNPNLGEIVIGAYARCGIRRTELTTQHMADAKFESNLLQSSMQGDGILLYEVVLQTQNIIAGVGVYDVDPTMVFTLDVYIRQNNTFQGVLWANDNGYVENWSNSGGSTMVWVSSPGYNPYYNNQQFAYWSNNNGVRSSWANNTNNVLNWKNIFPQVVYWANYNTAQSSWSNNTGYLNSWTGVYVPPEPDPIPPVPPGPPVQIQSNTIDRLIVPISRSDYAAISNKGTGGFPTTYWVDRLLQPKMYLWPVPTMDIPNGLQYYIQQRPQNADLMDGMQVQIPYEVQDYFTWALAERLAFIYAPDRLPMIGQRKQMAYTTYLQVGTENVPIDFNVQLGSYFG